MKGHESIFSTRHTECTGRTANISKNRGTYESA